MRQRDIEIATRLGFLNRIKDLEAKLLKINHVVEVEFDLDCFLSNINQVILIPKYDIPVELPNYYDVRKEMLRQILAVSTSFGLMSSGDRIEDYGEHFYIVRDCDETWVLNSQKNVADQKTPLDEQMANAGEVSKNRHPVKEAAVTQTER